MKKSIHRDDNKHGRLVSIFKKVTERGVLVFSLFKYIYYTFIILHYSDSNAKIE